MRRSLALFLSLLAVFLALPIDAHAAGKNKRQVIMALTEVANGAPVTVTITNPSNASGYLVVKTENENGAASLVVTVFNSTVLGDFLVCTSTAITTDTTTVVLLGSTLTAGDGITDVCDFAMGTRVKFVFTDSVSSTDFDVTADMEWVTN